MASSIDFVQSSYVCMHTMHTFTSSAPVSNLDLHTCIYKNISYVVRMYSSQRCVMNELSWIMKILLVNSGKHDNHSSLRGQNYTYMARHACMREQRVECTWRRIGYYFMFLLFAIYRRKLLYFDSRTYNLQRPGPRPSPNKTLPSLTRQSQPRPPNPSHTHSWTQHRQPTNRSFNTHLPKKGRTYTKQRLEETGSEATSSTRISSNPTATHRKNTRRKIER